MLLFTDSDGNTKAKNQGHSSPFSFQEQTQSIGLESVCIVLVFSSESVTNKKKRMEKTMKKERAFGWHKTIWAKGASDLIPERFRRIITVVMPIVYGLLILFGAFGALFPVTTVSTIIGTYGMLWSALLGLTALQSLIGLAYRLRIEIYSSIVLTVLLSLYPIFIAVIIIVSHRHVNPSVLAVFPAVCLYPVMPAWRVIDIVFEIRKARKRQLYAAANLEK